MTQHRFAAGVLALCAVAGLAGCGGGDDDDSDAAEQTAAPTEADGQSADQSGAAPAADDEVTTVPAQTAPPTVAEVNILTDFGDVCRGVALDGATAYDAARAGVHPLITMGGEPPTYEQVGALLPDKWDPVIGEEQTVELVACLDRTTATLTQTCDGYLDDDGNDSGNTVEMFDASYDVRLVAATTGEIVASTQMDATDTECPMLALFDADDPVEEQYAEPTDELTAWLVQYVET
jgi:hypothetical protein